MNDKNDPSTIGWLPLESNPDLLNGFLERMGVNEPIRFNDVFGMDDDLLAFVPQPCHAVCLLFPYEKIHGIRSKRSDCISNPQERGIYYLKQLDACGNACGTIACVHAIANCNQVTFSENSPLKAFIDKTKGQSPHDIGTSLTKETSIHEASEESAGEGQTATPSHSDSVDGHFIALIRKDGRLYELDGRMPGVVDHGPTTEETFLYDTARIVRSDFMALEPESVMFNLVALCG